jgi:hypothetical protein
LPVSFTLLKGHATLNDAALSPTSAGPLVVEAFQTGNELHEPASARRTFNWNPHTRVTTTLVGSWPGYSRGYAQGIWVTPGRAYLATTSGLIVFDTTDPAHPAFLGQTANLGAAEDVHVVGSLAYVAAGWNGLQVLDVANPSGHPPSAATTRPPAPGPSGSPAPWPASP